MSKNSYNYSGVDSNAVKKIIIAIIILASLGIATAFILPWYNVWR